MTQEEIEFFSKGLDFGIFPKFLNYVDVQTELENLYEGVSEFLPNSSDKIKFKTLLLTCYSELIGAFKFLRNSKISEKEHIIIDKFNKMENIMILTADKGKTVVFMYKSDYISKMKVILDDTTKFKVVTEDNTMEKHAAIKTWIRSHRHLFGESEYESIFPHSANMPILYGQPKLHKDGIPLRPVLSMVGSYNHGLATSVSKLLEPMRQSTNVCTDKFTLANILGRSNLHTS